MEVDKDNLRKSSPLPDPPIRTLKVELLSENSTKFIPCIPNSRTPTPFETEFFKGVAMIIIRTKPVDDFFKSFFMGKRLFEVQVQGKFKRQPLGEVFVGAEVTNKMELGILTRSISKAALRFCSTMVNDLHYSFGDDQSDPNFQLPHLVAPIFPTFDKILVTAPDEELPPMGIPFNEDLDYRKKRLKYRNIENAKINLDYTYSFSVNTSNLDLLEWNLVGIPMVRPIDLRMFFGSSSIQLIGYEIPYSVCETNSNIHPQNKLNYLFCLKLTPINPNELPIVDLPIIGSSEDEILEDENELQNNFSKEKTHEVIQSEDDSDENEESDGEDSTENETDIELSIKDNPTCEKSTFSKTIFSSKLKSSDSVSVWWKRRFLRKKLQTDDIDTQAEMDSCKFHPPDYASEAASDLNFCPISIELNDIKKEGRRRVYYFLTYQDSPAFDFNNDRQFVNSDIRIRSYSEIKKIFPIVSLPKSSRLKKLSAIEKRRKRISESYKLALKASHKKIIQSLSTLLDVDKQFLSCENLGYERSNKDSTKLWEGGAALALSRCHFTEIFLTLTAKTVSLKKSQDSKKYLEILSNDNIISVQILSYEITPTSCFKYLAIETFTRVYFLMLRSESIANNLMAQFSKLFGDKIQQSPFKVLDTNEYIPEYKNGSYSEREEVYMARPFCWKLNKKRVFNFRKIHFTSLQAMNCRYSNINPNDLIESILNTIFVLAQAENTISTDYDWVKFWDEISLLQILNLKHLNECERMAFFLNLYHIMILHGSLVFGPPSTWNYWNSFFNNICYIVDFELFSIAEIEHCLLRGGMSKSSLFSAVSMPAPPNSYFPGLGLINRDFRLHFAINNGSLSFPDLVPIYTPEKIDEQLDEITKITIEKLFEFDVQKKTVFMPKLPLIDYYYFTSNKITSRLQADSEQQYNIGSQNDSSSRTHSGNSIDCLRTLFPYFSSNKQQQLKQLLLDQNHLTIKVKNLNFKCRTFKKLSQHS